MEILVSLFVFAAGFFFGVIVGLCNKPWVSLAENRQPKTSQTKAAELISRPTSNSTWSDKPLPLGQVGDLSVSLGIPRWMGNSLPNPMQTLTFSISRRWSSSKGTGYSSFIQVNQLPELFEAIAVMLAGALRRTYRCQWKSADRKWLEEVHAAVLDLKKVIGDPPPLYALDKGDKKREHYSYKNERYSQEPLFQIVGDYDK